MSNANSAFMDLWSEIMNTPLSKPCNTSYPVTNFWDVNAKIYSHKEESDKYIWLIPFPGLTKDDIKVKVQKDSILISNKNGNAFVPKEGSREIIIPDGVVVRKIQVSLENGLLKLILPKAEVDEFDLDIK